MVMLAMTVHTGTIKGGRFVCSAPERNSVASLIQEIMAFLVKLTEKSPANNS